MDERANSSTTIVDDDTYEITFRNGALKKLRMLAKRLDIDDDNPAEVLARGMKVMELAEDNKVSIKSGKDIYIYIYIVDLKKI